MTKNESHKHEDQLDVPMSEKVADKCIVRPWEELQFKRNRYGLGYVQDADNLFHFPNYSEPVCFVSGGFLNDDKKTKLEGIGKEHVQDIVDDDVAIRSDREPYTANTVVVLAMISQTILIFTHADFVGRQITSQ